MIAVKCGCQEKKVTFPTGFFRWKSYGKDPHPSVLNTAGITRCITVSYCMVLGARAAALVDEERELMS